MRLKQILLQIDSPEIFETIVDQKDGVLKKTSEEKEYLFQFNENSEDSDMVILGLAVYLLSHMISNWFPAYYNQLMAEMLNNCYYRNTIIIELFRLFRENDKFRETPFINFNLKGIKEDLELIMDVYKQREQSEQLYKDIAQQLKSVRINIHVFQKCRLEYRGNELYLIPKKNPKMEISPSTITEKLPVSVEFDSVEDPILKDVSFCSLMMMLLKIQELEIPATYETLHDLLVEQLLVNDYECMITIV